MERERREGANVKGFKIRGCGDSMFDDNVMMTMVMMKIKMLRRDENKKSR